VPSPSEGRGSEKKNIPPLLSKSKKGAKKKPVNEKNEIYFSFYLVRAKKK